MEFVLAKEHDACEICDLLNTSYRGEQGWTTEYQLVDGDRATISDVEAEILRGSVIFLLYKDNGRLVACICIEVMNDEAHIGSFAVEPAFQTIGLGKKVLAYDENYAINNLGVSTFVMLVLSNRLALIEFYERRGYLKTGLTKKYPKHLNVGTPRDSGLTIEYLKKG